MKGLRSLSQLQHKRRNRSKMDDTKRELCEKIFPFLGILKPESRVMTSEYRSRKMFAITLLLDKYRYFPGV